MTKFANCLLTRAAALVLAGAAHASILNFQQAPCSAVGDGVTDDRPALARAFAAAPPGNTILVPPGRYRIVLPGGPLVVPAGVTLLGQGGQSKLLLTTSGKPSDYRAFLQPKSNVTLASLTIERDAEFDAVLLPIFGHATNIVLRHCRIIGNATRFPKHYCHAMQVGVGTVQGFTLDGVAIEDCSYGLFQANQATGTLQDVTVENCRFTRNTASDLEFNSPNGTMRHVTVRNCFFSDNACPSAAAGFAVGLANVQNGRVEDCTIRNYGSEALHVEDRSADIRLTGNTIIAGSTRQPNGFIMVLSGSQRVTIDHNFIDARSNTNCPHLILVTAGGKQLANPSAVLVTSNVLVNGASTLTWYLQEGSGPGRKETPFSRSPRPPSRERGGRHRRSSHQERSHPPVRTPKDGKPVNGKKRGKAETDREFSVSSFQCSVWFHRTSEFTPRTSNLARRFSFPVLPPSFTLAA